MHSYKRTVPALLACALLMTSAGGCVGYRLGSTLPPDLRSVHVPPVVNNSGEPLLELVTTRELLQELQRDGTLKVAAADQADSLLEITLVGFQQSPLRYERDNPKATREYRQEITAQIVFKNVRTGKLLLRKEVKGESTFDLVGDLTSAKRATVPLCARDLAHDIVESVVEYW